MSVLASIEPAELKADPGGDASLTVRVRNRGKIVDRFDIVVVGPTATWASVDQPSLRLFPDKEGEARVTFRPPRAPSPAADTYPFGVFVKGAADPDASTVEEGRITVAPFVELVTEIVPQTSRGSRSGSHEVSIHNIGNSVADVSIRASDPDRLLGFTITPERTGMRPDATTTVRARVQPKDTFFMGPPKRVPFSVQIDEPIAGSYQLPATLEQQAIIPSWVKPLAGLAIAGLAAVLLLPPILVGLGVLPGPSPSQGAVVSTGPTPTPVPTPSPPLPTPFSPPVTPKPSPTVGPPNSLSATGEDGFTSGVQISLACNLEQRACRDQVSARLVQALSRTLGTADGALLNEFNTSTTGTLVIVAKWDDRGYPFRDENGNIRGEAKQVAIDLAPLLAKGSAYALIDDGIASTQYVISGGNADLLLKSLYNVVTPSPAPDPSGGGGIDLGQFYPGAFIWGQELRNIPFGR